MFGVIDGSFCFISPKLLMRHPDGEGSTTWENTEYRSFKYTDSKDAHLEETDESKERCKEKPLSGTDAVGYN